MSKTLGFLVGVVAVGAVAAFIHVSQGEQPAANETTPTALPSLQSQEPRAAESAVESAVESLAPVAQANEPVAAPPASPRKRPPEPVAAVATTALKPAERVTPLAQGAAEHDVQPVSRSERVPTAQSFEAFWSFTSLGKAKAFAKEVARRTGLEMRAIQVDKNNAVIAFAYETPEQKASYIQRIESATALVLRDTSPLSPDQAASGTL